MHLIALSKSPMVSNSPALRKRRREWVHETEKWEKVTDFEGEFIGMALPSDVLEKVYYKNAERLLGSPRAIDQDWTIKKTKKFRMDLIKARKLSPTKTSDYSKYFTEFYRLSMELFERIVNEKGKTALNTTVSDK